MRVLCVSDPPLACALASCFSPAFSPAAASTRPRCLPAAVGVKRLARLGMVPGGEVPGMGALDMEAAEGSIVNNTREVSLERWC